MRTKIHFISTDMAEALEIIQRVIDALPDDPDNAEDAWQLFKVFQARDSLKAAYDYEREQELELVEGI